MHVTVEYPTIQLQQGVGRTPGVHVSGIIRAIATETGLLKPEWVEELSLVEIGPSTRIFDPVAALRISIGLAWESWYIPYVLAPEGIVDHPGELVCDGIYMSPDGEELTTVLTERRHGIPHTPRHAIKIHEIKATYKSTKTVGETEEELRANFLWMAQLMAYCKGANTRWADLHVLFLNGNYLYPLQPLLKRFRLEFDQQEIDDNWELLTNYANHRLAQEGAGSES